jgi:hypothetical protein
VHLPCQLCQYSWGSVGYWDCSLARTNGHVHMASRADCGSSFMFKSKPTAAQDSFQIMYCIIVRVCLKPQTEGNRLTKIFSN